MRLPSHLWRHPISGIYYFRARVPRRVQDASRAEFRFTLRTRDPNESKLLAYAIGHAFQRIQTMANVEDFKHIAQLHVKRGVDGSISVKSKGAADHARAMETLDAILKLPVREIPKVSTSSKPQAENGQERVELARGIDDYLTHIESRLPAKTFKTKRRMLAEFQDAMARGISLNEISDRMISEYHTKIIKDRKNNKLKAYSPKTLANIFSHLSSLFEYFIKPLDGHNPAKGEAALNSAEKQRAIEENSALPFDEADLAEIFSQKGRQLCRTPGDFFLPLMGLYTGARINELSQLDLTDIGEGTDGLWYIKICGGKATKKRVKNKASIRIIPLHPKVIEAGLPSYLEQRERLLNAVEMTSAKLWPFLTYTVNGWGGLATNSFAKMLTRLGVKKPHKSFHSFRAVFIQKIETVVNPKIGHAMTGHTLNQGEIYFGTYGRKQKSNPITYTEMANAIYPCLDWKHDEVVYDPAQFEDMLHRRFMTILRKESKAKLKKLLVPNA